MTYQQIKPELPLPSHFDPKRVEGVWEVPYEKLAIAASNWAGEHGIHPAAEDEFKIALIGIDVQNTFCIPGFELYIAGRSGTGAVDDNRRLVQFIYRNLHNLTHITGTMDTHQAMQIFHPIFLVNQKGEHPTPMTLVSLEEVESGQWQFNTSIAPNLGITPEYGQQQLVHYVRTLRERGKYDLTVWPYHAMLGGMGHALVSAFEEALFFYTIARQSQPDLVIKGDNPLSESYSMIGPEVLEGPGGLPLGEKDTQFLKKVQEYDAVIFAGQAKSHCVAWTISDLLEEIRATDPELAKKVYLLEDCSSPVVVPGIIDYTDQAQAAYQRFAQAGMHLVRSTEPLASWPGIG